MISILTILSFATASSAWSMSSTCLASDNNSFLKLESCLTLDNLTKHLKALQKFADANVDMPGTRFSTSAGYQASTDYVVQLLKNAGYQVSLQAVPIDIAYVTKPRLFSKITPQTKIYQDDVDYVPFVGSGTGDVTGNVQSLQDDSGCDKNNFHDFVPGNIALLSGGGGCFIDSKISNATAAGAKAVIIYNSNPWVYYSGISPTPQPNTPALLVTSTLGDELKADIQSGIQPSVHIKFNTVHLQTNSYNIIAESPGGDPNHVVMMGAHLDSSAGNAGMNDNGSAAATVLEIALLMQKVNPVNKLRFAWWTGEELRMLGSTYYVNQLSKEEKAKIALYLNYEILGAPNGARLIMAHSENVTPPGSEKITQTYIDYFKQKGLKYYAFDPSIGRAGERSDMYGFMQANIPVGYLVTGADLPWNPLLSMIFTDLPNRQNGVPMHPCYHRSCDKLTLENGKDSNFDFDLYLQMSKAAAYAVYTYAMQK